MSEDSLGDRMKGYESATKTVLTRRVPIIIRLDGKGFSRYTKGLERPFDAKFAAAMNAVAVELCKTVQGACVAYVQSDEISILVNNYKTLESQPWFDNEVQKMVSVSASVAGSTMTFLSQNIFGFCKPAYFDSRVFVLPEAEVVNAFVWRQQDNTRNSVQMLARSLYSHKELHLKNTRDLMEMCKAKGQDWHDLPTWQRRGRCILKTQHLAEDGLTMRHKWSVDLEIPVFTEDREYLRRHLDPKPEQEDTK